MTFFVDSVAKKPRTEVSQTKVVSIERTVNSESGSQRKDFLNFVCIRL